VNPIRGHEENTMGKNAKKDAKGQRSKKAAVKNAVVSDLSVKDATAVKGGAPTVRKAGGEQEEYLQLKLNSTFVETY
jgi:hypothetical protein